MNDLAGRIISQMLRGISGNLPSMTPQQKADFITKYGELAEKVAKLLLPNPNRQYSPAIGAVIAKGAIKYGEEKAIQLLTTIRSGTFNGQNDPARLLFLFILGSKGLPSTELYIKAIGAVRAYCEGRTITEIRPSKTDIFDWSPDFEIKSGNVEPTIPKESKNWWQTKPPLHQADHFKISFFEGEWAIQRKFEIVRLFPDGTFTISKKDEKPEPVVEKSEPEPENAGRWKVPKEIVEVKTFYTPQEVGEYSGYSKRTIQGACNNGRMEASLTQELPHWWQISYEELLKVKEHGLPKPNAVQKKKRPPKLTTEESKV